MWWIQWITMDCNYKLRSVIGREDKFTTKKLLWFDAQVCVIFLWSLMLLLTLVDYTDMRGIIGRILDDLLVLHVSMNHNIGSTTTLFYVSMAVYSGFNDHLRIHNLINRTMLSSLSKKQLKGKVLLKKGILVVDYKVTINMLTKYLYIAVRYLYITNQLISWDISRAIYKPTKTLESDYFTQAIQRKLIIINQLELTKVNVIKSIGSKLVRL